MSPFFDTHARRRQTLAQVFVPTLLINVLSLAIPLVVLQIYDRILPNQAYGTASLLLLGACIAILLDAFLRYTRTWLLGAAAANTERSVYEMLAQQLNRISFQQVKSLHLGKLQEGFKAIGQVKDFYSGGFVSGLIDVPFVVIFLGLVYYVGGTLVAIPILVWGVTAILVWLFSRRSTHSATTAAESELERSTLLVSVFSKLDLIKSQSNESKVYHLFRKLNFNRWLANAQAERQASVAQEVIQVAALGTSVAVVLVGSMDVLAGTLTTGGLAACSILSGRAVAPMSALMNLKLRYTSLKTSNETVTNLIESMQVGEDVEPTHGLAPLRKLELSEVEIEVIRERFRYSLNIIPGDVVALESTTTANTLLLGALTGADNIVGGTIKWNDAPASQQRIDYQTQVSAVIRQPQIVSGSLLDNLTGFDPKLNRAALTIAKAVGLQRVIAELPNGVETKVGMQIGATLSDGAVKLVAITAQLAKPTSLILLDLPEQDLDLESISLLTKVIEYYSSKGRSFVLNTRNAELLSISTKRFTPSAVEAGQ